MAPSARASGSRPERTIVLAAFFPLLVSATRPCVAEPAPADPATESGWPQWRGPRATGESPDGDPPIEWSPTQNLRWKTAIPGLGHSTPIVLGDRVFVTSAIPVGDARPPVDDNAAGSHDNLAVTHVHRFVALGVDRHSGKVLWQTTLAEEFPHEGGHITGSLASASPASDGERVYAFFGSRGLHALDVDGKQIWSRSLGRMATKHAHGEGSSPVLHGDTLAVNWDHEGQSLLVAFDKHTGEERWRVERDEVTSWASPIVVEHGGREQIIVSGTNRVRAYDLATGKVIWECGGLSHNVVASPVGADGMVFAASSYETRALLAIRLDGAAGDITSTDRLAWTRDRGTPYVPSPLLAGGSLYLLRHYQGILTRLDAATGKELDGPYRLAAIDDVYASAVAAARRVYVTDRSGTTVVLVRERDGEPRRLTIVAVNRLEDSFNASMAIAGGDIFLRGRAHLYRIARPDAADRSDG